MRGLRWTTLVVAALIGVAEYGLGQGPSPQTPVEMKTMTVAELEKAGDACRARKEYAEAIQYFREAVRKDKKNPVLYNKLGLAELRANDLQAARADFERATKYNSKYPEAWNNLGAVDYIHRNFGSAARYFKKAVALDETRASFHANLGNAWFSQKKIERAVREYSRAPIADPQHQCRFALMYRHHRVGSKDQLGPWPREADKDESGQDSGECESAHNLDRRDHMAVQGRRIHLSITDCRYRLDAEEERVREAIWPGISPPTQEPANRV